MLVVGAVAPIDIIMKALQGSDKENDKENMPVSEINCKYREFEGITLATISFPRTLRGDAATTNKLVTVGHLLKPGPHLVLFPIILSPEFDSKTAKQIKSQFKNMRTALGDAVTQNHTWGVFINAGIEDDANEFVERFPDLKSVVKTYCHDHTFHISGGLLAQEIQNVVQKNISRGRPFYGDGFFGTMADLPHTCYDKASSLDKETSDDDDDDDEVHVIDDENDTTEIAKPQCLEYNPSRHTFGLPYRKGKGEKARLHRKRKIMATPLALRFK